MWILSKLRPKKMNFVKNETMQMWILWKMRLCKCEFCEKWDFANVNFVKNETLKMWILWIMRLWIWNCEFYFWHKTYAIKGFKRVGWAETASDLDQTLVLFNAVHMMVTSVSKMANPRHFSPNCWPWLLPLASIFLVNFCPTGLVFLVKSPGLASFLFTFLSKLHGSWCNFTKFFSKDTFWQLDQRHETFRDVFNITTISKSKNRREFSKNAEFKAIFYFDIQNSNADVVPTLQWKSTRK